MINNTRLTNVIGLVVPILLLVVAYLQFSTRSDAPKQLQIFEFISRDLLRSFRSDDFEGRGIQVTISGEELSEFHSLTYYLENIGTVPILPSDYYENLAVKISDGWEILFITSELSGPSEQSMVWREISSVEFEADPLLINAKDRFLISIYARPIAEEGVEADDPNIDWNVRIANLSELDVVTDEEQNPLAPIFVILRLSDTIAVITFATLFTFIYLFLFFRLDFISSQLSVVSATRNITVGVVCMVSGFCASEAIVSTFLGVFGGELAINLPVIIFNAVSILVLSILVWKKYQPEKL
jgi:hypothetical protein